MEEREKIGTQIETDIEKIKEFRKIGEGQFARVYTDEITAYKILKENVNTHGLYNIDEVKEKSKINSDMCVFPNEILEDKNGEFVGYSMDLVVGEKLAKVIGKMPFNQIFYAIERAHKEIKEFSKNGIAFSDSHYDNIMWDEKNQKIKIIDTDFFKKSDDKNLDETNNKHFDVEILKIVNSKINIYGRNVNEELKSFYNLNDLDSKLSVIEKIQLIKKIIENDFGKEFKNIDEIEEILAQKQEKIDERDHLNMVARQLSFKARMIKAIAQGRYLKKVPFINRIIEKQIKMLPGDVRQVITGEEYEDTIQTEENGESENEFLEGLKNYKPIPKNETRIGTKRIEIKEDKTH